MNKYQESLNNLVGYRTGFRGGKTIIQEYINTLQELVDTTKTPTLEEVKKEWEDLGYDLTRHERLFLEFKKGDTYIMLYNYGTIKYEKYGYGYSQKITFQEHQLLTKTFRALGWEV